MSEGLIAKRKKNWKRLEELIAKAGSVRGLRGFNREEVRELTQIYRRTSSDLAIARVESRDQRLVNYLNNLVIRAHGMLYRTPTRGVRAVFDFYLIDQAKIDDIDAELRVYHGAEIFED